MSGSSADLTRVILALQEVVKASYLTQQTLAGGLVLNTGLTSYTVAGLPASAPAGRMAYTSNGRGPGEGAGSGTGAMVVGNGVVWRAIWSGLTVTV
jgi:hypothetical protein